MASPMQSANVAFSSAVFRALHDKCFFRGNSIFQFGQLNAHAYADVAAAECTHKLAKVTRQGY